MAFSPSEMANVVPPEGKLMPQMANRMRQVPSRGSRMANLSSDLRDSMTNFSDLISYPPKWRWVTEFRAL